MELIRIRTLIHITAMNKKFVLGIYDDEDVLLTAIENIRAAGTKIYDVFSPYPVHGIDDVLGIKRSRLPIVAFFCGLFGTSFALWMQIWMLGFDWPMIIGGKDFFALPNWIPIAFEGTVLFTAFGLVSTFCISNDLWPGNKTLPLDIRTTDDKFVMAINLDKNKVSADDIKKALKESGAIEVNVK